MPTNIKHDNLNFKFHLVNVVELNHEKFLYSSKPEDIVIAILCDFKEKSADIMIETILQRLSLFSKDELELGKFTRQLEILSNLRNLQELTIQKLSDMSFIYDLETDIRYQQGYKKAEEKATKKIKAAEQKAEDALNKLEKVVTNLLNLNILTIEAIAKTANTTIEYVKELEEKQRREKDDNTSRDTQES